VITGFVIDPVKITDHDDQAARPRNAAQPHECVIETGRVRS
jgi:hypothetical protein